jgi:hypothetical protein
MTTPLVGVVMWTLGFVVSTVNVDVGVVVVFPAWSACSALAV